MPIEALEVLTLISHCKKFLEKHGRCIKISDDMNEIDYVSTDSAAKCMAKALIAMRKFSVSQDTVINQIKAFNHSLNL